MNSSPYPGPRRSSRAFPSASNRPPRRRHASLRSSALGASPDRDRVGASLRYPLPVLSSVNSRPSIVATSPLCFQQLPRCSSRNSFAFNSLHCCRGVCPPPRSNPLLAHSPNPFRMNTCKSVSKQRTLSTFRMNTYEKTRGGGLLWLASYPRRIAVLMSIATKDLKYHVATTRSCE